MPVSYTHLDVYKRQGEKLIQNGYPLWEKESRKDEEHPLMPYNVTEPRILKLFPSQHINMQGRLLGGCMDILVMLLGTKYDRVREFADRYQEDGIIWFLEACDLNVMSIRRALWQICLLYTSPCISNL